MKIRKLRKEDLKYRVEWMNHPGVYTSMHFSLPITIEGTMSWFNKNIGSKQREDVVFLLNEKPIGMGGFTSIDNVISKAELYIFINPFLQGKGLGSKALLLLCDYGFRTICLNRIYLEVNEDNSIARKLYEKNGFELEGVLREDSMQNNQLINRCVYSYLKKDYDTRTI